MATTRVELVDVGGRCFRVHKPAQSFDSLVADSEAFPFWAVVFPSSVALGAHLLGRAPLAGNAIELGCGLGLAGLAGAAAGLSVTQTDLVPEALRLARMSARDNDVRVAGFRTLDWNAAGYTPRYDWVLAADILYDAADFGRILALLERLLAPGGRVVLTDTGRDLGKPFFPAARERFRVVTTEIIVRLHDAQSRVQIHELTHRA